MSEMRFDPPAVIDEMDVGTRVLCRGEPGTIIGHSPDESSGPAWWRVQLDNGSLEAPLQGSPFLKPLDRKHFLRAVLTSVAARHLSEERAAALIELVLS